MANFDNFKIIRPIQINDARLLSSNVPENDYPLHDMGATYGLGDFVMVINEDIHNIYKSQMASNTGNYPPNEVQGDVNNPPTKWLLVSKTNRWKMHDRTRNSQTRYADEIHNSYRALGPFDSIYICNVEAQFIQVKIVDDLAGIVFDQEFALVSDRGVTDFYGFCYEPYDAFNELYLTDLPKYIDATIEISILNAGGIAACGECVIGLGKDIGGVEFGLVTGISDYSTKETNEFGDVELLQRAFSDTAKLTIHVPVSMSYQIKKILTGYRAQAIVFIGNPNLRETWIYGFYTDFDETVLSPTRTIFTTELESLT